MGLLHFSGTFKKWLCLPFLAQLFIPEKALARGQPYKSTINLACELVHVLKDTIKQKVILVADGYFAKRHLLRTCAQAGGQLHQSSAAQRGIVSNAHTSAGLQTVGPAT